MAEDLIQYSYIAINIGNKFNSITNKFEPSEAGIYWFFFDIVSNKSVDCTMRDITTGQRASVLSSLNAENVLSRNDLRNLKAHSRLQMTSQYPYLAITWGGFSIDNVSAKPPIAFHVIRHNSIFIKTKFRDENFFGIFQIYYL